MKKIIRLGNKIQAKDIIYVKKCKTCGCKFVYTEDELHKDIDSEDYVECPQCGKYHTIIFRMKYKGRRVV